LNAFKIPKKCTQIAVKLVKKSLTQEGETSKKSLTQEGGKRRKIYDAEALAQFVDQRWGPGARAQFSLWPRAVPRDGSKITHSK
jgi:hypothetical protein